MCFYNSNRLHKTRSVFINIFQRGQIADRSLGDGTLEREMQKLK